MLTQRNLYSTDLIYPVFTNLFLLISPKMATNRKHIIYEFVKHKRTKKSTFPTNSIYFVCPVQS